jgi:hypothetical protein
MALMSKNQTGGAEGFVLYPQLRYLHVTDYTLPRMLNLPCSRGPCTMLHDDGSRLNLFKLSKLPMGVRFWLGFLCTAERDAVSVMWIEPFLVQPKAAGHSANL